MQLCAVVALLLACYNLQAAQAVTVTAQLDMASQVALGNVFVTASTEQVTLRVGTTVTVSGAGALPYYNNTGVGLAWNVTDFFGAVRASGAVERLPSGTIVSELKPFGTTTSPPAGFFVLNLRLVDRNSSDALLQSNFTTFAVLWVRTTCPAITPLRSFQTFRAHFYLLLRAHWLSWWLQTNSLVLCASPWPSRSACGTAWESTTARATRR
jgi:hypothetical protein